MLFTLALVPVFMWLIGRRPRLRSMWRAQFAPQRRQVMVVNARYIKDARTPESLCPPRDRLRGSDMRPQDAWQRPRFGPCGRAITRVIRSARAARVLPRARPHPLAICRPAALLHTGMGLDRVQRDVQPRAKLTPGEDQSRRLEAPRGRPGWLPRRAEILVLARADRPNSLLVEPKLMIARGP